PVSAAGRGRGLAHRAATPRRRADRGRRLSPGPGAICAALRARLAGAAGRTSVARDAGGPARPPPRTDAEGRPSGGSPDARLRAVPSHEVTPERAGPLRRLVRTGPFHHRGGRPLLRRSISQPDLVDPHSVR